MTNEEILSHLTLMGCHIFPLNRIIITGTNENQLYYCHITYDNSKYLADFEISSNTGEISIYYANKPTTFDNFKTQTFVYDEYDIALRFYYDMITKKLLTCS